jgi:hypothetical protein
MSQIVGYPRRQVDWSMEAFKGAIYFIDTGLIRGRILKNIRDMYTVYLNSFGNAVVDLSDVPPGEAVTLTYTTHGGKSGNRKTRRQRGR